MQKSTNPILVLLVSALLLCGLTAEAQRKRSKRKSSPKTEVKNDIKKDIKKEKDAAVKEVSDTVKKDNLNVSQREIVIDTMLVLKGEFKPYKDKAHVSYYADRFHGKRTASGKKFDMNKMTAAHKKLPFGTKVRVTNQANGKSVIVEITDRGPFVKGREIDLSKKAFQAIASGGGGYLIGKMEVLKE